VVIAAILAPAQSAWASAETPVAAFGYTTDPAVEVMDQFNASSSTSGAMITDYKWNLGDGTVLDGGLACLQPAGQLRRNATITDSLRVTAAVTQTVDVVLLNLAGLVFDETPLLAGNRFRRQQEARSRSA
jgi:hypothetical protein